MSGLDIFAWIVLIVLAASTIAVIAIAGALPGMTAHSRGHPWAQAVTVAGRVLLLFGFRALAGRADLGLCRRARAPQAGGAAMIVVLLNVYLVILFLLVKFKIVRFNLFWNLHRPRQGQPYHPQGPAAADRNRELHQSVLNAAARSFAPGNCEV